MHRTETHCPRDTSSKRLFVQGKTFGDTSVEGGLTLHPALSTVRTACYLHMFGEIVREQHCSTVNTAEKINGSLLKTVIFLDCFLCFSFLCALPLSSHLRGTIEQNPLIFSQNIKVPTFLWTLSLNFSNKYVWRKCKENFCERNSVFFPTKYLYCTKDTGVGGGEGRGGKWIQKGKKEDKPYNTKELKWKERKND